jgi:modification methylase
MAATRPGEIVLDPFFGTGTTGAVAKRLGRRWIGIERERDYASLALKRIQAVKEPVEAPLLETPSRRQAPRVPFGWLIERGLLQPGSVLFDHRRVHQAKVRADGTLVATNQFGDHRGSIHQVGAALQGLPACNGWTFWHFDAKGELRPIDMLRQKVLADLH